MECTEIENLLDAYIFKALESNLIEDITTHLLECKNCTLKHQIAQKQFTNLEEEMISNQLSPQQVIKKARQYALWIRSIAWGIFILIFTFLIITASNIAIYRHERVLLAELEKAIIVYRIKNDHFPKNTKTLHNTLRNIKKTNMYLKSWKNRMTKQNQFVDYWGNKIMYQFPGKHNIHLFDLYSFGKNTTDDKGEDDDITNWHKGR